MTDGYDSLAELENVPRERMSRVDGLRSKLAGKLGGPTIQRIRETIIPYSQ